MSAVFVILSSALIDNEMRNEFGDLAPAMLPVGRSRLYDLQIDCVDTTFDRMILTLPADYDVPQWDAVNLQEKSVEILYLNPGLSLMEALGAAVESIEDGDSVSILFGDTFVTFDVPHDQLPNQFVAVSSISSHHYWTYYNSDSGPAPFGDTPSKNQTREVVCGFLRSTGGDIRTGLGSGSFKDFLNRLVQESGLEIVKPSSWLDFGHLSSYYRSRRELLVSRQFNTVSADLGVLQKFSDDRLKMRAEANWYAKIPRSLSIYTPRFLGEKCADGRSGYALEYLYLPLISDLFVMGDLPFDRWKRILVSIFDLVKQCRAIKPNPHSPEASDAFGQEFFDALIQNKLASRFEQYCQSADLKGDDVFVLNGETLPPLEEIIRQVIDAIPMPKGSDISFWHGDLFFGNMMYDARSERVIAFDPRGMVGSQYSIYGDMRYDLAKLAHSILGGYDSIIAGRYSLIEKTDRTISFAIDSCREAERVRAFFIDAAVQSCRIDAAGLHAYCASMFLSALPLHSEDKQRQSALLMAGLDQFVEYQRCL